MKKLVFVLLFVLSSLAAHAQNSGFGLKAGLSSTKLDFENKEFVPSNAQTGYHLGVFARIGGAGFFVQPELLFTQTSGSFRIETTSFPTQSPIEYEAKFNRLDVPVMAGFRVLRVIRVMAGPIASFNINSSLKDASNTVRAVDFKSASIGYQAGVGLDIGNLSVEGKYEGGLSSFAENIGVYTADNRLNQWVLSVGFKLF